MTDDEALVAEAPLLADELDGAYAFRWRGRLFRRGGMMEGRKHGPAVSSSRPPRSLSRSDRPRLNTTRALNAAPTKGASSSRRPSSSALASKPRIVARAVDRLRLVTQDGQARLEHRRARGSTEVLQYRLGGVADITTTTIRLDEELKTRINALAERAGKTPHAFILDAIAEKVEQAELEAEFHRVADERWKRILHTGKTVAWDDAKPYLQARARGRKARKPTARKIAR